MRDAVLKCVIDNGGATFARLCRDVPGFAGDREISSPVAGNVIFWHNVSAEAIGVLEALQREKKLHLEKARLSDYWDDGAVLGLPMVVDARGENPLEPSWMPVKLCVGPR